MLLFRTFQFVGEHFGVIGIFGFHRRADRTSLARPLTDAAGRGGFVEAGRAVGGSGLGLADQRPGLRRSLLVAAPAVAIGDRCSQIMTDVIAVGGVVVLAGAGDLFPARTVARPLPLPGLTGHAVVAVDELGLEARPNPAAQWGDGNDARLLYVRHRDGHIEMSLKLVGIFCGHPNREARAAVFVVGRRPEVELSTARDPEVVAVDRPHERVALGIGSPVGGHDGAGVLFNRGTRVAADDRRFVDVRQRDRHVLPVVDGVVVGVAQGVRAVRDLHRYPQCALRLEVQFSAARDSQLTVVRTDREQRGVRPAQRVSQRVVVEVRGGHGIADGDAAGRVLSQFALAPLRRGEGRRRVHRRRLSDPR